MTRRSFWQTIVIGVGSLALPSLALREHKYGYMHYERWFAERFNERGASVFLNGRDITHGCVWFDDSTGDAECLKTDARGEHYIDPNNSYTVASERLKGDIRVVFNQA